METGLGHQGQQSQSYQEWCVDEFNKIVLVVSCLELLSFSQITLVGLESKAAIHPMHHYILRVKHCNFNFLNKFRNLAPRARKKAGVFCCSPSPVSLSTNSLGVSFQSYSLTAF